MTTIDPKLKDILSKYLDNPAEAVWNCHGTWVAYHKALEEIAVKAGITFDSPHVMEADSANKCVALCVTGNLGEKTEWATGEASPANCKNSYPFAMAEKRAKDRVILKLIGLHGQVYSEEESDDFKQNGSTLPSRMSSAAAKRLGFHDYLKQTVAACDTPKDLDGLASDTAAFRGILPASWQDSITDLFEHRRNEIEQHERELA